MSKYTKNLNLYLPEMFDPEKVYLPGFSSNFQILDDLVQKAISIQIADPSDTDNIIRKATTNYQMHVLEAHRASKHENQDFPESIRRDSSINPHQTSVYDLWLSQADIALGFKTSSDTIINALNHYTTGMIEDEPKFKMRWKLTDFTGITLEDIGVKEDRKHNALDISENLVDTTSENTIINKHVSNMLARGWEDHKNTIGNPHKTKAHEIISVMPEVYNNGADSIINEINTNATGEIKKRNEKNKIYWNLIDKENIDGYGNKANIAHIPYRSHNDLQDIQGLDNGEYINEPDYYNKNKSKNKHVSNNDIYELKLHEQCFTENEKIKDSNWVFRAEYKLNPHNVSYDQLYLTLDDKNVKKANNISEVVVYYLNSEVDKNKFKIDWGLVNKTGSNLTEIATRNHDDLQNVGKIDETSTDPVKNKHISNSLGKFFNDHCSLQDGSNPHKTKASSLYGLGENAEAKRAGNAIIETINLDSTVPKTLMWQKINFEGITLPDLGKLKHDDLIEIHGLDWTNEDTTQNKHISNKQGKILKDHADSKENPHNVKASQINGSTLEISGKEAIIEEINTNENTSQIEWKNINKKTSNLKEIETRNHDNLQNINEVDEKDNNKLKNKHTSNFLTNKFNKHVDTIKGENPHNTKVSTLKGDTEDQTVGSSIVEQINENADIHSLLWKKLNFSGISLSDIGIKENRRHNDLNIDENQSDWTDSDTEYNKHVSNAQMKKLNDHVDSKENPHDITAKKIGGNNIANELNEESTTVKLNKEKINWENISITDLLGGNKHSLLSEIKKAEKDFTKPNVDEDFIYDKHINTAEYKEIFKHLANKENPHEIKAKQIPIIKQPEDKINATNVQDYLTELNFYRNTDYVGLLTSEEIEETDYTIHIPAVKVLLYDNTSFIGKVKVYETTGTTYDKTMFQEGKGYGIAIKQVNDTAEFQIIDDITLVNFSNSFLFALVYRDIKDVFHIQLVNNFANGIPMKLLSKQNQMKTFERQDGLLLEDVVQHGEEAVATLHIKCTEGSSWHNLRKFNLKELDSSKKVEDEYIEGFYQFTHYTESDLDAMTPEEREEDLKKNPQGWKTSLLSTKHGLVDNQNYHLQSEKYPNYVISKPMLDGYYNLSWVYRDATMDEWYVVLGHGQYKTIEALERAQPPVMLPEVITEHAILIGKVAVKKGAQSIEATYRSFDIIFTNTSVGARQITHHNQLAGLQGGLPNEYYHITNKQLEKLNSVEFNADITDMENVNRVITEILQSAMESGKTIGNLDTIVKIAENTFKNNDCVKKSGDTMTGELKIIKNNKALSFISTNGMNLYNEIGSENSKFEILFSGQGQGIEKDRLEIWYNTLDFDFNNKENRILSISKDKDVEIYGTLITKNMKLKENLTVEGTLTVKDVAYFKHGNIELGDSILKTLGLISLNDENGVQSKILSSNGLKFESSNFNYIFKSSDSTELSLQDDLNEKYISLKSNDYSYFKNGIQINTEKRNPTSKLLLYGNFEFIEGSMIGAESIIFKNGLTITEGKDETSTIDFCSSSSNVFLCLHNYTKERIMAIGGDQSNYGIKNFDMEWVLKYNNIATTMYHAGNPIMNINKDSVNIITPLTFGAIPSEERNYAIILNSSQANLGFSGINMNNSSLHKVKGIEFNGLSMKENINGGINVSSATAKKINFESNILQLNGWSVEVL